MSADGRWCLLFGPSTLVPSIERLVHEKGTNPVAAAGVSGPAKSYLLKRGIVCLDLDEYAISSAAASLTATRWLREWSSTPQAVGGNLKSWLRIGETSLWWYMDTWLVESGYFRPLHEVTQRIDQIADLLDRLRPLEVIAIEVDPEVGAAARSLSSERRIRCEVRSERVVRPRQRGRRVVIAVAKLGRMIARAALHHLANVALGSPHPLGTERSLLVYSGDNWHRVYDPVDASFHEGDLHLVGVLHALARDHGIDFVTYVRQYAVGLRSPRAKRSAVASSRVLYRPFEAFVTFRVVRRALAQRGEVVARWRALSTTRSGLWDSAAYRGVSLASVLRERLDFFMSFLSLEAILDHELAREAIERVRPTAALVLGESRREARAILVQAQVHHVPSVALQHGRFADHHFALTSGDLGGIDLIHNVPLPDRFAVYGTRDREYLVSTGGVPESRVVITGAPRWDVLARWREVYQPSATRRRLGLADDATFVLLTTTEIQEMDAVAEIVCAAVAQMPGLRLVIKVHPAEHDVGRYRRIASGKGLSPVVLQSADLYELLGASIALASPISSTLIDAAMMGIPAIICDPLGLDRVAVLDHHPAISVTSSTDELSQRLRSVLARGELPAVDPTTTADFIKRFGFHLDGLAHRRVADLVRATESAYR